MKLGGRMAICVAGGLVLHTGARALAVETAGTPYQAIVDRNVFALKPAPRPEDNPPPKTPPPKITLQGITSLFGRKTVAFKVNMSLKPGEPPKEQSLTMSEGERQGEITVLEINEPAGTVKFNNQGDEQMLDITKDIAKPPAGPMPTGFTPTISGLPGVPPAVAGVPNPAPMSTAASVAAGESAYNKTPTRPLRLPIATPTGAPATATPTVTPQAQAKPMSREEQEALIEIHRVLTAGEVSKGIKPPLPPTSVTPNPTGRATP